MSASEKIKAAHEAIKSFLPPSAFIIVDHSYRNYDTGAVEEWGCQVYEDNIQPLDSMFMVFRCGTAAEMIEKASIEYETYLPNKAAKIAALEAQIAKLRGM